MWYNNLNIIAIKEEYAHEMSLLRLPREQGGGFPSCGRGASIRRRRECLSCEKRFTTYETVEYLPMVVIKKDGSRQSFDRSKVLRGIQRSCEKRPVSAADMERMASEIEQEVQNSLEREVSTEIIGEKVMEKLKKGRRGAYVRFASVSGYQHLHERAEQAPEVHIYRQFTARI